MSTATIPFLSRRGVLPFCASEMPTYDSTFDSVNLIEVSGDEGIGHAMQLWWMLENFTITPTGTQTVGSVDFSFTKSFSAFSPSLTDLLVHTVRGAVNAGQSISSESSVPVQPAFRQCLNQPGSTGGPLLAKTETIYKIPYSPEPIYEDGYIDFYIGYSSGRWKLFYKFSFDLYSDAASPQVEFFFRNPAQLVSFTDSGSFSLFGLTINWRAYHFGAYPTTGLGISASSVDWTF